MVSHKGRRCVSISTSELHLPPNFGVEALRDKGRPLSRSATHPATRTGRRTNLRVPRRRLSYVSNDQGKGQVHRSAGLRRPHRAGAIRALRQAGCQVPENCSVIGFADVPHAALSTSGLTTIRQPMEQMGSLAAGWVLESLDTPKPPQGAVRPPMPSGTLHLLPPQ